MSCSVNYSDPRLVVILCPSSKEKKKEEKVTKLDRDAVTVLAASALHSAASC